MATTATATHHAAPSPQEALADLDGARAGTLALVAGIGDEDLERVHSPIMSPLVWDLGHIAAYEDLWLGRRHAGLELLRPDLAELYDAFETPRAVRGEIEALGPDAARDYLAAVRARTAAALAREGLGDGTICEMVLRHELQHSETMRQTLAIAGLLPAGEPRLEPVTGPDEWIEVPAGRFELGAHAGGFAYDNERPRHTVELPAFQIARRPVTNADWTRLSTGAGASEHPDKPVCHVSWFEAESYATASGARLPSEAEWEKAASSGLLAGVGQVWEWTASHFGGYPGFRAHPYREYSEVFFGEDYRVLRGSSWATHPRVASPRFRNWDLPVRRQIFAGVRLARDGSA
ncbi:MAG TPA: SUMF1/EgtB/PvdO family nonheme iron enzyme [Solirubrobacteraceae bacterium]